MRFFWLGLFLLIANVLQTTLLPGFWPLGQGPDLILILVVFYAFLRGSREGARFGLVAGLLTDIVAGKYIGLNAGSKLLVGYLMGLFATKLYKENYFVPIMTIAGATLINTTVNYLAAVAFGRFANWSFGNELLLQTLNNAVLALVLYRGFLRIYRKGWLGPRE